MSYPDNAFDLIVSTTAFDHWSDQRAGLRECARTLAPNGQLILVDLFPVLLTQPSSSPAAEGCAPNKRPPSPCINQAGFNSVTWNRIHASFI